MMSEQQFLWNSLDGGENVFIKEGGSDKIIHIKIMEGKHEFVDFMKKVNEQQAIIRRDEMSIKTMMSNMKKLEEEKVELMEDCACQYRQIQKLESENEDLREVNKENQLLHEENVKQCERWKNLYELKDSEVTARVDTLNRVCKYYLSETRFKGDTDPNEAVKEVINEILNAPIYEE